MLLKEKIAREHGKCINLYREGMFWKLYNTSAFYFSKLVKPYVVKKKFMKELKIEVVSIGFPDAIMKEVLEKLNAYSDSVQILEKIVEVELREDIDGYGAWFNQWKCVEERESDEGKPVVGEIAKKEANGNEILIALRDFPIMQKTPLEVQLFVLQLQDQLKRM